MQTVTLSFFHFKGLTNKLWAFSQMQFAHKPLRVVPDIGFYKLFGSGTGESFTPVPHFGIYAILATWPSVEDAKQRMDEADVFKRYRRRADEHATFYLKTYHAWGEWDGGEPFDVDPSLKSRPAPEPIGVMTRATIRKRSLLPFWRSVPEISDATTREDGLLFKRGIGEIPWLHQVTFSIWSDRAAMMRFAYQGGCHAKAAKAAHDNKWFSEELFARFSIVDASGRWEGEDASRLISKAAIHGSVA